MEGEQKTNGTTFFFLCFSRSKGQKLCTLSSLFEASTIDSPINFFKKKTLRRLGT